MTPTLITLLSSSVAYLINFALGLNWDNLSIILIKGTNAMLIGLDEPPILYMISQKEWYFITKTSLVKSSLQEHILSIVWVESFSMINIVFCVEKDMFAFGATSLTISIWAFCLLAGGTNIELWLLAILGVTAAFFIYLDEGIVKDWRLIGSNIIQLIWAFDIIAINEVFT